jgi:uncharacterized protein
MNLRQLRPHAETVIAAALGIAFFLWAGLPTPTLSGAMVGVAVLLGLGRKVKLHHALRDLGMLISGVAMGASVTPEMLQGFQRYPLSLVMLFVVLGIGMLASYLFFRIFAGWDRDTAFFASVPGALSVVLATAASTRADLLKVTMVQSFRLFVLLAVLPSLVTLQGSTGGRSLVTVLQPVPFAVVFLIGAVLSALFVRLGVAAPWIFGGMLVSALLHGTGLVVGSVPTSLTEIGFGLVGIFIGTRFSGISKAAFMSLLVVSVASVLMGLSIAVGGALLAERLLSGVTFGQALVAFAPGALEGMIILGAALGLDPIYVGLHHLIRFFGIGLILPLLTPFLSSGKKTTDQ